MVALYVELFLFVDIMTVVIHYKTYFPVGLLFTYIDNAHFLAA